MKKNDDIFKKPPVFTHNGEKLDLITISQKQIYSVTITYLSCQRKVKQSGFKGLFGFKKVIQDEKEITITDPKGIKLYWDKNELVTIRFWNQKDFEALIEGSYDEGTIFKRYIMSPVQPYQFNFHVGNLIKVEWEIEIHPNEFETASDFTFNHGYFPEVD